MYKKIKDEKILKIQESNMSEALQKLDKSANENLIDEDEIIEILIAMKAQQLQDFQNMSVTQ